jgi:capsid protein
MANETPGKRRQMTFLDRAISVVSPKMALERVTAREQIHQFAAVRESRARGRLATASQQGSSESWMKTRERIQAIWQAREMVECFCILSGLMRRLPMYVLGALEYQPQTGNERADRMYADYFHDWCERADYSGRHRLKDLAIMGFSGAMVDGQHGFIEHVEKGELRLQAIEGDRIGNPASPKQSERNIAGIKIDDRGRVESYEIYRRTRLTQYQLEGEVKPERFIHLFFPTRADQYHGVSMLAPALPHAQDMYELLGHEKVAAKFASSFAGIARMKDPGAPGAMAWEEPAPNSGGVGSFAAQAGTILRLEAGAEDIVFPPGTQRPSGAFMALLEALIREIALALVLPYGFVYNMAAFGGVTARLETQSAQRTIRGFQEKIEDLMLNRIKRKVLLFGIAKGDIPATKNWNKGAWRYGAAITGDVGHQTSADLELVAQGAKTISMIATEHGGTFGQIVDEKGAEILKAKETSERLGVPMELLLPQLNNPTMLFANMARAEAGLPSPDAPPPPPPGLIGTLGEKAVKPLIDLLEKVSTGAIDRESGVMAVMKLYGMTYAAADKIVPAGPVAPTVVETAPASGGAVKKK